MSQRLVDRSPDLKRLRDEGFDLSIVGTHLLIRSVPYVNGEKIVRRGTLVSVLELHQDRTKKPEDHVARFAGERPCDAHGTPLPIIIGDTHEVHAVGVETDFTFSTKPRDGNGYADYYVKMKEYIKILVHQAQAIDPEARAETFPVVLPDQDESSPFKYRDTASSRAGIEALSPKLAMSRLAIVGLGGTGSYVLDLVAKTAVGEIHLFDDDRFLQHNAFRSPGVLALEDLRADERKVDHYCLLYSKLRHGIVPHPYRVTPENAHELRDMQFVFLCLDSGEFKDAIMRTLEDAGVPFIDVGMGVHLRDGALSGIIRVTTSTPAKRDHVRDGHRVSFAPAIGENEYSRGIQVADLNALNATLAVIKWKKLCGFYHDLEAEHHSAYTIETSRLSREDQ
ncbi:MAG: ThiF family adenylyltransferase [Myxococcota bacterium]